MHDAVELFLQLACEHLDVAKNGRAFTGYWDPINSRLGDQQLSQRQSMHRLNDARNSLKHSGTRASDSDIESLRASTTAFFQENTRLVFDVQFDDLSMVDFVNPASARERLYEAERLIREDEIDDALGSTAEAFLEVMDAADRDGEVNPIFRPSIFSSVRLACRMNCHDPAAETEVLAKEVEKAFETMQTPILMHILGIDLRRYAKFKGTVPEVHRFAGGNMRRFYNGDKSGTFSANDARFCVDFVISSSISIEEFWRGWSSEPLTNSSEGA